MPSTTQARKPAPADGPDRFLNRELSWLAFNSRVLSLAEDAELPLLERVKFVAICARNLDEFFQVRVAGLKAQVDAGVLSTAPCGRSPSEQLQEIRLHVEELVRRQERLFAKELVPRLAAEGIFFVDWDTVAERDRERMRVEYENRIHPALTPLAVDPAHPFPWISNLSLNLAVLVQDGDVRRFARVKVPPMFPRFLDLGDGRFLPLERLIAAHLDRLFPGTQIVAAHPFRVTRDAELLVDEDDADDLLVAIESGLHRRLRVNDAVRLEIDAAAAPEVTRLLGDGLELGEADVYLQRGPLDLGALWQVHGLDRPDLKDPPWQPVTQARLAGVDPREDLFAVLRAGDVMVQHPYDSFRTSVEAFFEQAARDPDVLAIKHTLYRTAGRENRVLRALIQAAQEGKEVVTLVEIKARFDEEANIEWARSLESAGGNVVYGLVGLKTHGKVALVVRRERDGIRRYCHIGTGNYNPETVRVYEDVGLLTASPEIGADVGDLFNHLTGCGKQSAYRKLLVAPATLRSGLVAQIREEIEAGDGEIVIKVNGLQDPDMIDALYEASRAGVRIDLLVRSICCLRPGVPGLSETVRVRSVVGRYLEHSRIFRFGSEARGRRHFIGSADLMSRNLDRRVEVLAPVEDPALRARLDEILAVSLDPEARAWELAADGRWSRSESGHSPHARLQELARTRT